MYSSHETCTRREPFVQARVQSLAVASTFALRPSQLHATLGLTSNFFVVEEDGAVCTAASGVLCGTMRQLVILACEHHGIPMRLEAPDMTRASRWREAFLTGERGENKFIEMRELMAGCPKYTWLEV